MLSVHKFPVHKLTVFPVWFADWKPCTVTDPMCKDPDVCSLAEMWDVQVKPDLQIVNMLKASLVAESRSLEWPRIDTSLKRPNTLTHTQRPSSKSHKAYTVWFSPTIFESGRISGLLCVLVVLCMGGYEKGLQASAFLVHFNLYSVSWGSIQNTHSVCMALFFFQPCNCSVQMMITLMEHDKGL